MRYAKLISAGLGLSAALAAVRAEIPAHPNDLNYPTLSFKLPAPSQFRHVLSNGTVVFIAEDRMFPTFDMSVVIRAGSAEDEDPKYGLASLVGSQLRDGGTRNLTPGEFDEKLDFLAASISTGFGENQGFANLSCLSKDIDEALTLFHEMLRYPRFDVERFRIAKERMLQNIKRRNDSTAGVAAVEWDFLMYGDDYYGNRYPSKRSLDLIKIQNLFTFHDTYVHPGNMIIAVSGDFSRDEMISRLESLFGVWPPGRTGPTMFYAPTYDPVPGVYLVNKPDVNQGRVSIGHRSAMRGTDDEFALQVMNAILGGGGFRSRLMAKVRSDEGLAYNTGSRFNQGVWYPEDFVAWFQSKSNACAYATRLVIDEIKRIRQEPVTQQDVDDAVNYYAESFPGQFPDKMSILRRYAADEYTGRDPGYWLNYIDNLRKVTPQDVQRVARDYLKPDQLVILGVGNVEEMRRGGFDKAPNLTFDKFGKVRELPLRNPDTLLR